MPASDTTLKKLQVVLTGNSQQLQTAMKQAETATRNATDNIKTGLNSVQSSLKSIAKLALTAIPITALVSFGKSCVQLGSDLTEVQNVVDVTFGKMSSSVDAFAKNAKQKFGLSETTAKKYASTMGAMLKSSGFDIPQAYEMSTTLTGLAADMASLYNLSTDEAFTKIQSGINGITQPLNALGVRMSEANLSAFALSKGITKSYSAMSESEKIVLRYNYLLEATKDAHGDAERTAGEWAGQLKRLKENFNEIKATIGQGLIMALLPIIKFINMILEKLQELANKFKYIMAIITGQDLTEVFGTKAGETLADEMTDALGDAEGVSDSVDGIADSLNDATKEAKSFLLSFDEIHKLGSETDKDTDSDNGNALGIDSLISADALSELDDVNEQMDEFKSNLPMSDEELEALKQQFQPVIDFWENEVWPRIQNIGEKLGELYEDHLKGLFDNIGGLVSTLWDNVLSPFIKWVVDEAIPAVIDLVGHLADTVSGAARAGNGVLKALTATTVEEKEEAGFDIVKGIDDTLKGVGGFMFGWIPEKIFGVKDAQKNFKENWEQKSAMQNASDFLHLDSSKTGFNIWQYVTPEIEKMIDENGGHVNENIAAMIAKNAIDVNDWNPWHDLDYAKFYHSQTGNTAAVEALGAFQDYMDNYYDKDFADKYLQVYGGNIPGNLDNPKEPPATPLTKEDMQEAMENAINNMPAIQTGIYLDGEDVGTLIMNALFGRNVRINPEAVVADGNS